MIGNALRIIARIDVKNEYAIKGIQLEGLRKIGDPKDLATLYYTSGIDELLFMDAVATLYGRNNLFSLINHLCSEIFIPVTIGGGIRDISDAEFALANGADRVAVNTAAVQDIKIITEIAKNFGSQAIVGSIEAKLIGEKSFVYTHNGREPTEKEAVEWAKRLEDAGCGEILVTSIDRDGTKKGFDRDLNITISSAVSCPVVASGGFGHVRDLDPLLDECPISGIAIGSALHYRDVSVKTIRDYILNRENLD